MQLESKVACIPEGGINGTLSQSGHTAPYSDVQPSFQPPAPQAQQETHEPILQNIEVATPGPFAPKNSTQVYLFMGFTPSRSEELFRKSEAEISRRMREPQKRFSIWDYDPCDFDVMQEVAVADFKDVSHVRDDFNDWDLEMDRCGIASHIKTALMKPEHRDVRIMQSLDCWLKAIVTINLYTWRAARQCRYLPFVFRGYFKNDILPTVKPPPVPPGHTVLYLAAACSVVCYYHLYLRDRGKMDRGFKEYHKSEFYGHQIPFTFFTPQKRVARKFAAILHDACKAPGLRILQIHVPNWAVEFAIRRTLGVMRGWEEIAEMDDQLRVSKGGELGVKEEVWDWDYKVLLQENMETAMKAYEDHIYAKDIVKILDDGSTHLEPETGLSHGDGDGMEGANGQATLGGNPAN